MTPSNSWLRNYKNAVTKANLEANILRAMSHQVERGIMTKPQFERFRRLFDARRH